MNRQYHLQFHNREVRRVPEGWVHPTGVNEYSTAADGPKELHFLPFELQKAVHPGVAENECMPCWSREEASHVQLYCNAYAGIPISPVFASESELASWLEAQDQDAQSDMTTYPSYGEWLAFICHSLVSGDSALWPEETHGAPGLMDPSLILLDENEETTRVFVNGSEIGSLTYDALGWSGMDTTRQLLADMAEALGVPIIEAN